ncbi:MAG: hypothetical protein Kow00121_37690 [Elainellaceae cyanobacterium]
MISKKYSAQLFALQRKTTILVALVGSVPLSAGKKLRQIAYRSLFAHMAPNVEIEPGVQWIGTGAIELGHQTCICSYTRLNSWEPESRLIIGNHSKLDQGVHIATLGGRIEIDEHTYIGPYVCMAGPGAIHIGKNCLIASHSGIYANNHVFNDPTRPIAEQGVTCKGIVIEDDCWLGSGVRVLDGVTIGQGSIVGAGAVVTKDISPYSVAVGVPARVVSKREAKVPVGR